MELGVAKREEASVGAHEVVAKAVGRGSDGHYVRDMLAEVGQVAVELGVTEGGNAAVGGDHPVTLGGGAGGHAHDPPGGSRGGCVPERLCCPGAEDVAVGGGQPVAGRGQVDDLAVDG